MCIRDRYIDNVLGNQMWHNLKPGARIGETETNIENSNFLILKLLTFYSRKVQTRESKISFTVDNTIK